MKGMILGRYELGEELGSGGMGVVHRASVRQAGDGLAAGDTVALKLVHPHLLAHEGYLPRFCREAEIGRRIRHPNVVRTYAVDEAITDRGRLHFLVMEFVEGQTLRQFMDEMGRVPEGLCRHIGNEIARGLTTIHAAGVVHRDLKPENVLITPAQEVKIMDLGVAQLADAAVRISQTGAFLGSLEYAAPEQLRGQGDALDGRADLHALGVLLYELATSVHPFRAPEVPAVMRKILEEIPRRCGLLQPSISEFFEGLVDVLLAKDPDDRPASADGVLAALTDGETGAWWTRRARSTRAQARPPLQRALVARETGLHGRDAELEILRAAWSDVRAGEGRVVLIRGEPGVGKTRLLDELVTSLLEDGEAPLVLYGAYPPGDTLGRTGALLAAFREHFGTQDTEARLAPHLGGLPGLVSPFAALIRGTPPAPEEPRLTDESVRTAFLEVIRSLAADRPTVVIIDDLHRASADGIAVFAALARAVRRDRVLLVATQEPGWSWDGRVELMRLPHVAARDLHRLGPKALTQLLLEATGSPRLAHDLAGQIALKTDGNPFFVFEVLQLLREEGVLRRESDGAWTLHGTLNAIPIPSSVADLVQTRIARLEAEDRNLLDVGACIGLEFDPLLVAQVLERDALSSLRRFARLERDHQLVRAHGRTLRIDHPCVRDSLYEGLFGPLRDQYHALIAEALVDGPSEGATPHPESGGARSVAIFEHALQGGRPQLARRYRTEALTHLLAVHQHDKAIDLLERSLAEPGFLEGEARVRGLLALANELSLLGRPEQELRAVNEALIVTSTLGPGRLAIDAQIALGSCFRAGGRHEEAESTYLSALQAAEQEAETDRIHRCRALLGLVLHAQGRHDEAEEQIRSDLAYRRETASAAGQASALTNLALIARGRADYAEARAMLDEALALAQRAEHALWEANARSNLAGVCYAMGEWDEARRHAATHHELVRSLGHRRGEAVAQSTRGLLAFADGHCSEALECHRDAIRLFEEIGDEPGVALEQGNLALCLYVLGRLEDSAAAFDDQLRVAIARNDMRNEVAARLHRHAPLLALGSAEEARETVERALDLATRLGRRRAVCEARLALGQMAHTESPGPEAVDSVRASVELATELGIPKLQALGTAWLARHGEEGREVAIERATAAWDRLERPEQMELAFALYELTGDGARLAVAQEILRGLRADAPARDRAWMIERVPLHRAIAHA